MALATEIAGILGGPALRRKIRNDFDLMQLTAGGLPSAAFAAVVQKTGVTQDVIVRSLGISKSSLARHLKAPRLTTEESEKTVRFVRAFADARATFDGNEAKAREWLHRPNRGLGGRRPLELLSSELGARQVELVLGRLREGVVG